MRLIIGPLTLALLVAGTAQAAPAQVTGGGFYRDGHARNATKTSLSVEGRPATNSGTATYAVQGPGKARSVVQIKLGCVVVDGRTAYASGTDASGTEWFLKVVDNGEPGRADQFGVSKDGETLLILPMPADLSSTCRAGDVQTRAITGGGNFRVVPAS